MSRCQCLKRSGRSNFPSCKAASLVFQSVRRIRPHSLSSHLILPPRPAPSCQHSPKQCACHRATTPAQAPKGYAHDRCRRCLHWPHPTPALSCQGLPRRCVSHRATMPLQPPEQNAPDSEDIPPISSVPHLHGLVITSRGDAPAIGRPRHRIHTRGMSLIGVEGRYQRDRSRRRASRGFRSRRRTRRRSRSGSIPRGS